jgi:hypothetical protein
MKLEDLQAAFTIPIVGFSKTLISEDIILGFQFKGT